MYCFKLPVAFVAMVSCYMAAADSYTHFDCETRDYSIAVCFRAQVVPNKGYKCYCKPGHLFPGNWSLLTKKKCFALPSNHFNSVDTDGVAGDIQSCAPGGTRYCCRDRNSIPNDVRSISPAKPQSFCSETTADLYHFLLRIIV
jgi:hypothetical protein